MSQIAWSERPAYGIESDAFARAWNRAFRSRLQVRDYTTWSHTEVGALVHISGQLHPRSLLAEPIRVRPHWSTPSIIGALRSNAHRSLSEIGHEGDNGKIDAFVSKAVRPLLDRLAVKEDLEARSGLKLSDEPTLQYATYRHAGAHIDLHLDTANYGDLTAILCLDYQWCNPESEPSATLLFTPEGLQTVALQPGELLVFDGSTTPHARTPLTQG